MGLGVVAAVGLPGPAPAAERSKCFGRNLRGIAANLHVRVTRERGLGRVVACHLRTGREVEIGVDLQSTDRSIVGPVALAGRFVAYSNAFRGRSGADIGILVRDVRTGRTVRSYGVREFVEPGDRDFVERTSDLVLRADGTAAWIFEVEERDDQGTTVRVRYEVHRFMGREQVLLDSGTDVEPGSLALAGSRLYWMKGGQPRSVVLD